MNVRALPVAAVAIALSAAGCGRDLAPAGAGMPAGRLAPAGTTARAAAAPIIVKPSKLTFTTKPRLVLRVSESGYTGRFTITVASTKIAMVLVKSAKGPKASVPVKAVAAGATTIAVSDASHHKVSVPVSVTTAIVIVN
jgi:hypothetical protein